MTMRAALLSGALVAVSGILPGPSPTRADEKPKAAPLTVDLSGRWIYDRSSSDDAREKMREAMQRGGATGGGRPPNGPDGGGGTGGTGRGTGPGGAMHPPPGERAGGDDPREAMRAIFEPADEMVVTQTDTEIAIDEKFGETRRLHPDGKKRKTDNGTSETKAYWKDGKLLVETKGGPGGMVETWEVVSAGNRIIVNVKMEGSFGPSLALKRIYDRAQGDGAK
jgi:hypothetical protein